METCLNPGNDSPSPSSREEDSLFFLHPYPFQLFAAVVAFGLTFRANLAYARYWEGRGSLASMGSKFTDVAIQTRMFSTNDPAKQTQVKALDEDITHLLSLMHALCLQTLRGDALYSAAPENIVRHEDNALPSLDCTNGDFWQSFRPNYELEFLSRKFYSRAKLPVVGGLRENEIEELFKGQGLPYEGGWTVRGERRQSMQHKGGWTVSGRPTLQQRQNSGQVNAAVVDQERVVKVMETIGRLITLSVRSKILDAPAPIISRVFQVLSEGHERGFMFARKISSTPFPFPFAQSIELFVTFFSLSVGVIFASWLDGIVPVIFFSFVTSWCYLTLNEVCRMLEEPFGGDANDLPLAVLQHEFNMRIVRSRFADSTVDQWEKKTAIE
ncbi:hypothetical protein TrST_g2647 [Triparma strigata]|uniref:Uncharacterized protein n=1 Tax=Triparma strigata TaxID=1606541 RepID=A0A9W7BJY4_9STRA|nr:hypothetical protein TrST_g2647 [Triparma strigata]